MGDVLWTLIGVISGLLCVASWSSIGRIADDYVIERDMAVQLDLRRPDPRPVMAVVLMGVVAVLVTGGLALAIGLWLVGVL